MKGHMRSVVTGVVVAILALSMLPRLAHAACGSISVTPATADVGTVGVGVTAPAKVRWLKRQKEYL